MFIAYRNANARAATLDIIEKANAIIEEYEEQGFTLTLRGLYYKFIGRDLFPDSWIDVEYNRRHGLPLDTKNTDKNYNRLGEIITEARYTGRISWTALVDITRSIKSNPHWSSPIEILQSAASQFQIDKWEGQRNYIEVWIEKDAALGVISGVCEELDIPYLSCRGYTSASEMWGSAQRLIKQYEKGRRSRIFHFGDHDPSGIDMSRDITDRINEFFYYETRDTIDFQRLALNMDQIRRYAPPPNPAKLSDSRCKGYIEQYGKSSWELDALEPAVMVELIREGVADYLDFELYGQMQEREQEMKDYLAAAVAGWDSIVVPALSAAARKGARKGGARTRRPRK